MRIKIDQSGKIEDTSADTVLAFCNSKTKSILISKGEKRKLQTFFRSRNRGSTFIFHTFAILIFLLIQNDLEAIQHIIIDLEYSGKDYLIKDYLLRLIRQTRSFDKRDIDFEKIGKKSRAHVLAIGVFRKERKPDLQVLSNDIGYFVKQNYPGLF